MAQEATLTTPTAAAYIGVAEATLRGWAKSGKVPHSVTPSGRLRFSRDDLDRMIRRVEPTSDAA